MTEFTPQVKGSQMRRKVMAKKEKSKKLHCTSVGGQAVLEGVMMQGKTSYCTAVRDGDGEIQIERKRLNRSPAMQKASKIPFVRGVVNMVSSLVRGSKTLMRSAAVYGDDDEEPSKLQKWFAEKFKCNLTDVIAVISTVLGFVLAFALFLFLPQYLVGLITKLFPVLNGTVWKYLILGVIKLIIFLAYLGIILLMKDIRRLYQYHGAEHKTINCYEKGLELTPQNVATCSRIHDRCGTSFIFIVLIVNVVIISLVMWAVNVDAIANGILRFLAKIGIELVLLPVIAGISYEILKILARFHGPVSRVLKSPGMLLQKVFTTREPDLEMIEVAIAAFNSALAMDEDENMEETSFVIGGLVTDLLNETKAKFAAAEIDESDAEWIYSTVLGLKRSELQSSAYVVKSSEAKKIREIEEKRLTGRPLWYIFGDADFYDCKIKVDERVLIPRPETEILAEAAVKTVEEGYKVLDMCTGSGCIAIAVAKHCKDKNVSVTAADVSEAALMLAEENAKYNSVDVKFVRSDLFDKVRGRFDLIVCNPPYIKSGDIKHLQKEVKDYEPKIALDGGDDGLEFYRRLANDVRRYLVKGGMLMLECGENQAEDIIKIFGKCDYYIVMKDYQGIDRFLKIAF